MVRLVSVGVLIGIVCGAIARIAMRAIALAGGEEGQFTLGATAGIISEFVVAALGGAWGARIGKRGVGVFVAVIATTPVTLSGVAIGVDELSRRYNEVSPGTFAFMLGCAAIIGTCAWAAPILSWRRAT